MLQSSRIGRIQQNPQITPRHAGSTRGSEALTLLANFARALAHRIRTPLAVISNELTFIGQADDCAIALKNTREISHLLRECCRIPGVAGELVPVSLEMFSIFGPIVTSKPPMVRSDPALLSTALEILALVCTRHLSDERSIEFATMSPWCARVGINLKSVMRVDSLAGESFHSFTEFLCNRRGLDLWEVPFVDAIFDALQVATRIEVAEERAVKISFVFQRGVQ